ncbi:threonine aldolase family protein [Streptomyces ziwulingensis]|uniref:threonine aldolase family protein n=1 Tax=Streptomyces ziwulingensis TaxID=1045501 RepID=UPI003CD085EB
MGRTGPEPSVRTDAVLRHDPASRELTSDNHAGAHPEVLAALSLVSGGHQKAYGEDAYTQHLEETFRRHFGPDAQVFPVFNGTGANIIALEAVTHRWGAVVCSQQAHLHGDEGGAPEHMAGVKLLTFSSEDGKLTPCMIDDAVQAAGDVHSAQPQAVSFAQSTELGTCYTLTELHALTSRAHAQGLAVHMDGARLANAAVSLGTDLAACTTKAGVDILSFGGTKNGLLFGECVVVLNPSAVAGVPYLRKRSTHLASKMRFLSVQFEALLEGDLWKRNATRANEMARRLSVVLSQVEGVTVSRPVDANAVFARFPAQSLAQLRDRYSFYVNDEETREVRLMCSFDTTEGDVESFGNVVRESTR